MNKADVLCYINELNKLANISIEYAVLEPLTNDNTGLNYNLHLVFTPKIELLLSSYISGSSLDAINETVITDLVHETLIASFIPKEIDTSGLNKKWISSIKSVIISNIARFCNFKFKTSTDPFLSMFLEEHNIIWKTRDFDTFFFSQRNEYIPSKYQVSKSVMTILSDICNRAREVQRYGQHYYKEKEEVLYGELYNAIKLYFITTNYLNTDKLSSSLDGSCELILSTLSQAYAPWDYIEDCYKALEELAKTANKPDEISCSLKLKNQALNFLHYKINEEFLTTNN